MTVVEVVPGTFGGWQIHINGFPMPRTYDSRDAAAEEGEYLAKRWSAELRVRSKNGDGERVTTRYTLSPGYR